MTGALNFGGVSGLSCSATRCLSLSTGTLRTFDGTDWDYTGLRAHQARGLACTTGYCLALALGEANDVAVTASGTTPVGTYPLQGEVISLSCAVDSSCHLADASRITFSGTGGTWARHLLTMGITGGPYSSEQARLSCVSASFCMAGGRVKTGPERTVPAVATFDGSTWSEPSVISEYDGGISSVDCGSPTFCMAADEGGSVRRWNGTVWGSPTQVLESGAATSSGVSSLSCVGSAFCVAVGSAGANGGFGRAAVFRNGVWQAPKALDTPVLVDVTCTAQNFCVAADKRGGVFTYDGSSWSDRVQVGSPPAQLNDWAVNAVSCGSESLCVLVQDNVAHVWDGTSWSGPQVVDARSYNVYGYKSMADVSCGTPSACTVATISGNVLTYTRP